MLNRRRLGLAAGMAAAVTLTAAALVASTADAQEIGALAPGFTAATSAGETVSLADYAGETVVLEWTNHGCPFVKKHYSEPRRSMQSLQAEGVVWLTVASSAPGEQGYVTAAEANDLTAARGAAPRAVLLDPEGALGRLYGAETTPHIFVVNADGALVYAGAIDSIASARVEDLDIAENYVRSALADLASDRPVATPTSKAYGCSVKYAF